MKSQNSDQDTLTYEIVILGIARDIAKSYRVTLEHVVALIGPALLSNKRFCEAVSSAKSLSRLKKMRVYKEAVSLARRSTYYALRQYRQNQPVLESAIQALEALNPQCDGERLKQPVKTILQTHVSTIERRGDIDSLFGAIDASMGEMATVLDVGSGVFPLMFAPEWYRNCGRYMALDRDAWSIRAMKAYAVFIRQNHLIPCQWSMSDGWETALDNNQQRNYDIALMLKVVPVVKRQSHDLLKVLAKVPAKKVIVTGSKQSMVKRRSIERREYAILMSFSDKYGFTVTSDFETDDEIGLILEHRQ